MKNMLKSLASKSDFVAIDGDYNNLYNFSEQAPPEPADRGIYNNE